MVVVLSDNSTGSDNVVKEEASELKKPILPIYLEETEIPRKLQYQLAGIQHLEVYGRDISNLAGELPKRLTGWVSRRRLRVRVLYSPYVPEQTGYQTK